MRYVIIANPRAGSGRGDVARRIVEAELRQAGVRYDLFVTEGPGDAERLAREWAGNGARLVAVGGDGTLHEVGNGLMQHILERGGAGGALAGQEPPTLGWIPAGTGNDLARTLRIPKSPRQALALILAGTARVVDVGQVNGRCFFNVSGVGFDARVAEAVGRLAARRGRMAYALAALRLLPRLQNPPLTLRAGDVQLCDRILLVAVGNCRYYGGGIQICPRAREDDGLFDICVAGDLGRLEVLRALGASFRGAHLGLPKVAYHTAAEVEIEGPDDVLVHADGQIVGRLPARYRMLPRALGIHCAP